MKRETKKQKQIQETAKEVFSKENTTKIKENIRAKAKEQALEETSLTEEQIKEWEKIVAEAKMPVELNDDDFKCGEGEVDIRNLNDKNASQMMFRVGMLNVVYLRNISQSLIDIQRLLMVLLTKDGDINVKQMLTKLDELNADLVKALRN